MTLKYAWENIAGGRIAMARRVQTARRTVRDTLGLDGGLMKPKITVVTTLLLCVSMTTFIPATGSRAEEKTCQAFGAYANGSSGNDQSRWDKRMNQWFGVDPKSIRSPANITKMIDWVESCIKHGSPRNGPEGLESVANQLRNDLARLIKSDSASRSNKEIADLRRSRHHENSAKYDQGEPTRTTRRAVGGAQKYSR